MRQLFTAFSVQLPLLGSFLSLPAPARRAAHVMPNHLKRYLLLLLVAISSLHDATAQSTPPAVQYPRLSKTLDSLAFVDQWPMQRIFKQQPDSAGRNLVQVEKENFARHQPLLEKMVRQYGYPGFRQVGEKSSNNFWLLVQHADAYPTFQRQVLKLMRREVKRKNANPENYAYLTDRVALNAGQLSEYGTQVTFEGTGSTIRAIARPLRDPSHVNKRRAALGLEPLETYLENSTKVTREMNAPKGSVK
ncbi:DUF6624 domain-containing protein [Hymenobacter sublimis]|uniref:Uncharacterized protein n=1 Tax=Hymenobacter sublimis TaxID=2933777 RepID=A0ABY4JBK5_9BACT|nr:DUF6624 domain-containing protein [Hymenobacter sublimis]UPL50188.1 hypothetical protein MWH26_04590 [Hymenobacter sublimis]